MRGEPNYHYDVIIEAPKTGTLSVEVSLEKKVRMMGFLSEHAPEEIIINSLETNGLESNHAFDLKLDANTFNLKEGYYPMEMGLIHRVTPMVITFSRGRKLPPGGLMKLTLVIYSSEPLKTDEGLRLIKR